MAKLEEMATLLNVEMDLKNFDTEPSNKQKKVHGKKRRAWLDDNNSKKNEQKPVDNQKGSINPVYKPRLSTPFINFVYRPLIKNGSKGVYRPLFIDLDNLRGNTLRILLFLYGMTKQKKKRITKNVTFLEIGKNLEISRDSIKTGLRFLLRKKIFFLFFIL